MGNNPINQNEFNRTVEKYLNNRPLIKHTNQRIIILFLGIPCSGKTSLAKVIEIELKGLRISKDELAEEIIKKYPSLSKPEISIQINQNWELIFNKVQQNPNKLLILDTSIDRKYKEILDIIKTYEYETVIINLEIDHNLVLKRLKQRNPDNYMEWYKHIDQWEREHEEAVLNVKTDITERNLEYDKINLITNQIKSLISKRE